MQPDDVVLEIGPGLGSLTLGLLEAAAHVVAVEIDPLLAGALPATVAEFAPARADALSVVEADALKITTLPYEPTRVVANLPYNVSVPVLLHLLATFPGWRHGLVMVQAEVADRLAAGPGSKTYGIPSVKMSWYAETTRVGTVPPSVFWPVPNVDSGLVSIVRRPPRRPPPPGRRCSRWSTRPSPSGARCCGRPWRAWPAPRPRPPRRWRRPGSIRPARGEVLDVTAFARIAEQLTPSA